MPEPLLRQLSSFLLFILGGFALGFAFDVHCACRRALRPRGLVSFLLDIGYWLAALGIVLPLLEAGTSGEPRFFAWLALLIGLAYYLYFLRAIGRQLARGLSALIVALFPKSGRADGRIRSDLPPFEAAGQRKLRPSARKRP